MWLWQIKMDCRLLMQDFLGKNPQQKTVEIIGYNIQGKAIAFVSDMFLYTFYNITVQVSD